MAPRSQKRHSSAGWCSLLSTTKEVAYLRYVFSRPLNALRDKLALLFRRVDGKLFQIDGPWNAKHRCLVDASKVDEASLLYTEQIG